MGSRKSQVFIILQRVGGWVNKYIILVNALSEKQRRRVRFNYLLIIMENLYSSSS